jgi:ferritin-like metal-binding protein YciE
MAESAQEKESEERSDDQDGDSEEQEEKEDPTEQLLLAHLMDCHALEEEATRMYEGARDLLDDDELVQLFEGHIEETREHEQAVRERIEAHDEEPEAIKDLTMSAAASVGLRYLNEKRRDTPVKLAMHLFCFENVEVGAYEFLIRFAQAAGDEETAQAAEKILGQEREMVEKLRGSFDQMVDLLSEFEGEDEDESEDEEGGEDDEGDGAEEEEEDES